MRIVLGVDGSSGANAATQWVAAHGPALGAEVEVVHVICRTELWGMAALQLDGGSLVRARRSPLRGPWTEPLRAAGLKVSTRLARGDPAVELCSCAEALHASLLVIGATHHTALHDLLGGTAHKVANHSSTPVVLVPAARTVRESRSDPVSATTSQPRLGLYRDYSTSTGPLCGAGIGRAPQGGLV